MLRCKKEFAIPVINIIIISCSSSSSNNSSSSGSSSSSSGSSSSSSSSCSSSSLCICCWMYFLKFYAIGFMANFDVYRVLHRNIFLQYNQLDAPMYQIYFILE